MSALRKPSRIIPPAPSSPSCPHPLLGEGFLPCRSPRDSWRGVRPGGRGLGLRQALRAGGGRPQGLGSWTAGEGMWEMLGCSHGHGLVSATLHLGLSWQYLCWTSHLLIQGLRRPRDRSRSQSCWGEAQPSSEGGPSSWAVQHGAEGRKRKGSDSASQCHKHSPHQERLVAPTSPKRGRGCRHLPGALGEVLCPAPGVPV